MKFFILFISTLFITLIVGCSSSKKYNQNNAQSTLTGSWHTNGLRYNRNKLQILERKKEQFFRNGQLLSSKWFAFKDRSGQDLGEYYITKLFNYRVVGHKIVAKFNRCSVGIVRELKVSKEDFYRLQKRCRNSLFHRGKVTIKRFKFINHHQLIIANKIYSR